MHLHRTFMLAKLRPLKQGEAEIDGGRIERIKGVVEMVEIHTDEILDMKRSGEADQLLRKNRRRCASRETRLRPPMSSAQSYCGTPCGRVCRSLTVGKPRYRGDSRGK